jgi:hypothetical protein
VVPTDGTSLWMSLPTRSPKSSGLRSSEAKQGGKGRVARGTNGMKCPQSTTKLVPTLIRAFPSFPIEVCARCAPRSPCLVADGTPEPPRVRLRGRSARVLRLALRRTQHGCSSRKAGVGFRSWWKGAANKRAMAAFAARPRRCPKWVSASNAAYRLGRPYDSGSGSTQSSGASILASIPACSWSRYSRFPPSISSSGLPLAKSWEAWP